MSRQQAINSAQDYFSSGAFFADLSRRVAIETESQERRADELSRYLTSEIGPTLERLGFTCATVANPMSAASPFLLAERREDDALPTVLMYGHGDVVRGQETQWDAGKHPWKLITDGDRIYGRGTVDNKGQHTINIAALEKVLKVRGKLGFNVRYLIEMGEELGSPGLREVAEAHREKLAADVFIASDGPRLRADTPMMFLGSRGVMNIDFRLKARQGAHHSGNWGGLLENPAVILVNAIATIVGPRGAVLLDAIRSHPLSAPVKRALAKCDVDEGPEAGAGISRDWGEPGYSPAERVFGSNTFEILALHAGNPEMPVNAIPPEATARCQIRFIAGSDWQGFVPAIREHLDVQGYGAITLEIRDTPLPATSLSPEDPWALWVARSVQTTTGKEPIILPNTGGSLPNDIFSDVLAMPTIWIPHGHGACAQHAPNEHMLASIAKEALGIMAGLYWDLGEGKTPYSSRAKTA